MTTDDMQRLKALLARHEGLRLRAYVDTVGKVTIGYGRNLTDVGISATTADDLLDEDIARTFNALADQFGWFGSLDAVRQRALIDMAFMGPAKLLEFRDMIAALARGNYDAAAAAMLDSLWARQVKGRATELAEMIRTGEDITS